MEGSCGGAYCSWHLTWCGDRAVFSASVTVVGSWSFRDAVKCSSAAARRGARKGGSLPAAPRRSATGMRNCSNIHIPPESHHQPLPLGRGCSHRNVALQIVLPPPPKYWKSRRFPSVSMTQQGPIPRVEAVSTDLLLAPQ